MPSGPTNAERNAEAHRVSQELLAAWLSSGIVTHVEVIGDPERCMACREGFIGIHPILAVPSIPHPDCDHEWGFCAACYLPVTDADFGR